MGSPCSVSVVVRLGTLLCCTVYEVHVQRRTSIEDKREHREESHTSYVPSSFARTLTRTSVSIAERAASFVSRLE